MPIHNISADKIVIEVGQGDVVITTAREVSSPEGQVDHIIFLRGERGTVGRKVLGRQGEVTDDWSVKIVLPCQDSWKSLMRVLTDYAIEKWGEVPNTTNGGWASMAYGEVVIGNDSIEIKEI